MENWYEKSINALQLSGMSERTQASYNSKCDNLIKHLLGLASLPKSISEPFRFWYARRCPLYDYQVRFDILRLNEIEPESGMKMVKFSFEQFY